MKQQTLPSILEQIEQIEAIEAAAGLPGQYTGERVRARDPERYQAIVDLLADGGMGINRIGKLTHTHPATIIAIRDASPALIEAGKKRVAKLARSAAQMTVESMIDTLADPDLAAAVPFSQRAIAFGILTDKAQLADGGPTEIVRHDCPSFDDFNAQLAAATGRGGKKAGKGGDGPGAGGDQGGGGDQVDGGEVIEAEWEDVQAERALAEAPERGRGDN